MTENMRLAVSSGRPLVRWAPIPDFFGSGIVKSL